MQVKVVKDFNVDTSRDNTWALITDIDKVVRCLPGASLEEKTGENTYKGKMSLKIGPLSMNFGGEATVTGQDESTGEFKMSGKGADKGGKGMANMDMVIKVLPEGDGTKVAVDATLDISGKLAQFGGRIIDAATNSVFQKFVENFKALSTGEAIHEGEVKPLSAMSLAKGTLGNLFKK